MRQELDTLLQAIVARLEVIAARVGDDAALAAEIAIALRAARDAHRLVGRHPSGADPSRLPRTLRIVVGEDDALVRMTLTAVLTDLGHRVIETGGATEALKALAGGADLLITDLNLPDGNGADLAVDAQTIHPGLAVIIASGEQRPDRMPHVWLQKPFNSARLKAALRAAVPGD